MRSRGSLELEQPEEVGAGVDDPLDRPGAQQPDHGGAADFGRVRVKEADRLVDVVFEQGAEDLYEQRAHGRRRLGLRLPAQPIRGLRERRRADALEHLEADVVVGMVDEV